MTQMTHCDRFSGRTKSSAKTYFDYVHFWAFRIAAGNASIVLLSPRANTKERKLTIELVDTEELARRTNTAAITWAKRRMRGGTDTPPYIKIGRCVRYRWSDVEAWLTAQERGSTSEAA